LEAFAQKTYKALSASQQSYPPKFQHMLPYMQSQTGCTITDTMMAFKKVLLAWLEEPLI
jgi:hypothetical protein